MGPGIMKQFTTGYNSDMLYKYSLCAYEKLL
jgi:hypothetical protein